MGLIAVVFMIGAGIGIAMFVLTAMAIAQREAGPTSESAIPSPERDRVAASLLFQILTLGGTSANEALRVLRAQSGLIAPVTAGIDVTNWAEAYCRISTASEREWLLEMAVRLIAGGQQPVPLRQYVALLDLSFSLGFQTDALARLRQTYGFDYVDHAKAGRPREADRSGGSAPRFGREGRREAWLEMLRLQGAPSRQDIIAAYRRLAAQHHPDRFFGGSDDEQSAAAQRFIEITRAYEGLLSMIRD